MNWETVRDLMAYALELMQHEQQAAALDLLGLINAQPL